MTKKIKNSLLFGYLIIFVLTLSIGYSAMSQSLLVSGNATLVISNDIYISNVELYETLNGGIEGSQPTYNGILLTANIALPTVDSAVTYKVTIKNTTNNKTFISSEFLELLNPSIKFELIGLTDNEIINAGEELTFLVKYYYSTQQTRDITNGELVQMFNFETTTQSNLVAKDGLLLYLDGNDPIYNDKWYDRSNHQNVQLNNISHSGIGYYFNGTNSCALTERTIVPTTGNFTVEVLIETGNNISGDKAIVGQEILGQSGEKGRTKFFNLFEENGSSTLRLFTIASTNNDTVIPNYTTIPETNTGYHLTVVRKGQNLLLYINGTLIQTIDFNINNVLSDGTTQIGCYDSISNQNYVGDMRTIRIYNRDLTEQEVVNNYLEKYSENEDLSKNLIEYVVNNNTTATSDGLYYNEDGSYVFKGQKVNNYIYLSGELWRIISIENDRRIKIIRAKTVEDFAFDESGNRNSVDSTYCTYASTIVNGAEYHGCNIWGKFDSIGSLGNTDKPASIVNILNTDIYNSFTDSFKNMIIKSDFNVGIVTGTDVATIKEEEKSLIWNGNVGTVTVSDVLSASTNNITINSTTSKNWLINLSTNTNFYWTMNASGKNSYDVWTVVKNNSIAERRASRLTQEISDLITARFTVLPVVYINGDISVKGVGTEYSPFYVIN